MNRSVTVLMTRWNFKTIRTLSFPCFCFKTKTFQGYFQFVIFFSRLFVFYLIYGFRYNANKKKHLVCGCHVVSNLINRRCVEVVMLTKKYVLVRWTRFLIFRCNAFLLIRQLKEHF